ncbi:MAG TPA: Lpg1974 family pore-forming outer membrane protein [Gammaproteobacteria bacterium]|nr:Lpg1974 family pore-forming outer membrane protein [Gammaproteobacteria bacterium]
MKKFSVVLAAAGLTASLGAYATLPTDATPFSLNIPNLQSGLEITLEGLLVRPDVINSDYATLQDIDLDRGRRDHFNFSDNRSVQNVNPSYDFGFRVGLGYIFPDSGNDVQLSWTHFQDTNTNSTGIGDNEVLVTGAGVPLINPNIFGDEIFGDASANTSLKNQFDAVDLTVGQYVNIGTRLQTRLFGGLRYAYVQQNQTSNYGAFYQRENRDDPFLVYGERDTFNSKFNGLGPRLGFQAAYNVWDCFGVTGSVAGSLLVGKVKSSSDTDIVVDVEDRRRDEPFSFDINSSSNVWRVVPELDARLGLNYTWTVGTNSALTLEGGYQVTQYFNAVDKLHNNVSVLNGVNTTRETSDVGFDGPYLSLNYKM